jgi:hypothetical protein
MWNANPNVQHGTGVSHDFARQNGESPIQKLGRSGGGSSERGDSRFGMGLREKIISAQTFGICAQEVWSPFTREYHGCWWPGMPGFMCWVGMLFISGYSPDPKPVLVFVGLWTLAVILRRMKAHANFKRGFPIMSYSNGVPTLFIKAFKCGLETALNLEAIVCLGISMLVTMEIHAQLGIILFLGSLGLCICRVSDAYADHMHSVVAHDNLVRMQAAAERLRR